MDSDSKKKQRDLMNQKLLAAVWANDEKLIDLCLQKGADINAQDAAGRTALVVVAVNKKSVALTEFILSKTPDVWLENKAQKNVFELLDDETFSNNAADKKKIEKLLLDYLPDLSSEFNEAAEGNNAVILQRDLKILKQIQLKKNPDQAAPGS